MTKKDYELLAQDVKAHFESMDEETQYTETENAKAEVKYALSYFARAMERDNPNFDREKFELACGF